MITKDRQYRAFEFEAKEDSKIIEGYAIVFDQETVLYEYDGVQYKEVIERGAFDKTSLADVVLNIDHAGKPLARTKNNTLQLTIDAKGLFVRADLSGTEAGRDAYEEIKGGYFDKMSFAFDWDKSKQEYDSDKRLRTVKEVKRVYDVSVVTFPAYEQTTVSARSFFEAEAEKEAMEIAQAEQRKIKTSLLIAQIKSKI